MTDNIIEIRDLRKNYGQFKALDGVDMNIERGSIYGLVGENGSGKSTIIKMIMGIAFPSSGQIKIFDSIARENQHRDKIGALIEEPSFFSYLSAYDNLEYYRIQRGVKDRSKPQELLDSLGLGNLGKKKYREYSLGMKQRLSIALALLTDPEILVLDEPINGLDPQGIVELRNILRDLNRERGLTIIISSHILGELSQIASHYGFISHGRIVKELRASKLEEECRNYLSIKVDDIDRATVIIEKELGSLDYKVNNQGYIELFDYIDRSHEVVEAFYKSGLKLKSIKEEGMSLEDYYMDLMGGGRHA